MHCFSGDRRLFMSLPGWNFLFQTARVTHYILLIVHLGPLLQPPSDLDLELVGQKAGRPCVGNAPSGEFSPVPLLQDPVQHQF